MKWSIEKKIMTGAGMVLALLLVNALISYRATRGLIDGERLDSHTHQALAELEATLSAMKDVEIEERGYIINGELSYLEAYRTAVDKISEHTAKLEQLTAGNPN